MILTDYYVFRKRAGGSRFRFDYVRGTNTYVNIEKLINKRGELYLNIGENIYTRDRHNTENLTLSHTKAITKICTQKVGGRLLGYGDWLNTEDAILFVFHDGEYKERKFTDNTLVEIFIARGQKRAVKRLFFEMSRGLYNPEILAIRRQAVQPQKLLFEEFN